MQKMHVIRESTQIINEENQSDLKNDKRWINTVTLVPDFAKRRVNLPILVKKKPALHEYPVGYKFSEWPIHCARFSMNFRIVGR